ncbi:MAG: 16S rRNA (cytosine(1402)-N(4))-methyltransferase RsmH [Candidatus Paceibacterota bacterium]
MRHQPVLLQETLDLLNPQPGEVIVDGTVGYAGHAKLIAERLGPTGTFIGFDEDIDALTASEEVLAEVSPRVFLINDNYRRLAEHLAERGIKTIDGLLLDLGLNSVQLESSGRGFSFQTDEPLLMTFRAEDSHRQISARDIVNTWSENDLVNVIFGYGEEQFAKKIARGIVNGRQTAPIETTGQLTAIISAAVPSWYKRRKIHPATKTFQALRIAVNDELPALKQGLAAGWSLLNTGGRLVVITFHSLEAGPVKDFFRARKKEGRGELINKKVIKPGRSAIKENPRSRSAQIRGLRKI